MFTFAHKYLFSEIILTNKALKNFTLVELNYPHYQTANKKYKNAEGLSHNIMSWTDQSAQLYKVCETTFTIFKDTWRLSKDSLIIVADVEDLEEDCTTHWKELVLNFLCSLCALCTSLDEPRTPILDRHHSTLLWFLWNYNLQNGITRAGTS